MNSSLKINILNSLFYYLINQKQFFKLLWASLCIYAASLTRKIITFLSVPGFKVLFTENQLNIAYVVLASLGFFSFIIYGVITSKKRRYHVTLGTFVLILVVFLAGLNFGYTRNTLLIKSTFSKDCANQLNELPESEVQNLGCEKYVKKDDGTLDDSCKSSDDNKKFFKFQWEPVVKEGKEISVSELENACLNGNCCQVVAEYYAHYPRTLNLLIVALTLVGLLISYISFHLSHKEKVLRDDKGFEFNIIDGIFLFLLLALLITACILMSHQVTTLPDYRSNHLAKGNPEPTPKPEPGPKDPEPEPKPEPEPEPKPEPKPEPEPEPKPEPEPEPKPEPEPEPEPKPEPEPEPKPEPEPEPEPKPEPEPPLSNTLRQKINKNGELSKNDWLNDLVNKNTLSMKNFANQQCQLVKNLIEDQYFKGKFDFNVDEESEGKGIRVSILASRGSFKYEKDNSGKLFFLETSDVKNIVFDFIQKNPQKNSMPFFSVLGLPNDVNQFLNEQLFYCGANPQNLPHFLIENYVTAVPKISPTSAIGSSQEPKKKKSLSHQSKSKAEKAISEAFNQLSPATKSFIKQYSKIEQKDEVYGDSYPQEQCHNFYNQELKRTNLCNFYYGDIENHKGNFSLIPKPIKISQINQKITGRVVTVDYSDSGAIKYATLCNQKVIVKLINEISQEVEFASASTDSSTGQFTFTIPVIPNSVKYNAKLIISNPNYQENIKIILLGGLNGNVDHQIGDIHLTMNTKPGPIDPSNKCSPSGLKTLSSSTQRSDSNYPTKKNSHKKSQNNLKVNKESLIKHSTNFSEVDWCQKFDELKAINDKFCPFQDLYDTKNQKSVRGIENKDIDGDQYLPPISRHFSENISNVQFRNIEVSLVDILSGSKIDSRQTNEQLPSVNESAIVKLFRNNIDCSSGYQDQQPIFIGEPTQAGNSQGKIIIYNQVVGDYTLQVTYKNNKFHSYCQPFTLSFDSTKTNFLMSSSIVRRNTDQRGSGVVVLENRFLQRGVENLSASLSMSLVFNDEKECLVSSYSRNCADFTYYKTSFAQAISFKNTYNKNQLFFVSKMANTPSEQTIIEQSRVKGKDIPQNPDLQVNNSVFLHQDIVIKVYAPESDFETATYYPPAYDSKQGNDPTLTWLSFCVNGNYGLISQKPVNQYYTPLNKKKQFPNSKFCDSFYQSHPYSGPQ